MKCKKCGSDWNSASGKVLTKCPFCDADLTEKENTNDSEAVRAIKDILKKYGVSVMSEKARFIGLFGDYAPKLAHEKRILQFALDEYTAKYFIRCSEADREKNIAQAQKNLLEVLNEKTVQEILEIFTGVFGWNVKIPETAQKPAPQPVPPILNPIPPMPKPAPLTPKPALKNIKTITIYNVRFGKGKYTGEVNSAGYPHGYGEAIYSDGNVYKGEWKDNTHDGKGKLTYRNGWFYEGEWKDGKYDGKGKMTYGNGWFYEGEWKDGLKNGQGKMTYVDGMVYEGEWEDGKYDGKGKLTYADGTVKEGLWIFGHFRG